MLFGRKKRESVSGAGGEIVDDELGNGVSPSIEYAGHTDTGKQRSVNQDQFLIADMHKSMHVQCSSQPLVSKELAGQTLGKLLFVADGVGGANAGEVASQMAIQGMAQYLLNSMHWLFQPTQVEIKQFVEDLKAGAKRSHELVCGEAASNPEHRGMGTTLTVAYLMWPLLYVLHIGDSRCYILRDGSLKMLTRDQTLAQYLLDSGQLTGPEFEESPYHHVLLSSIGGEGGPDAVVYKTHLSPGDRVMLCSDGVNAHLDDSEIQEILAADLTADEICKRFIDSANDLGGKDNITAVVAVSKK